MRCWDVIISNKIIAWNFDLFVDEDCSEYSWEKKYNQQYKQSRNTCRIQKSNIVLIIISVSKPQKLYLFIWSGQLNIATFEI